MEKDNRVGTDCERGVGGVLGWGGGIGTTVIEQR